LSAVFECKFSIVLYCCIVLYGRVDADTETYKQTERQTDKQRNKDKEKEILYSVYMIEQTSS